VTFTTLLTSSLSPSSSFALRWPPPCLMPPYLGQPTRSNLQGGLHQLCFEVAGATFASVVHELPFAWSRITLILDPTVWLDGARLANTCILPFFLWMVPAHCTAYPGCQCCWGRKLPLTGGYAVQCVGAIQGKEGRIQVLASLAPSIQTVGSNIWVIHEQAKCSSWMIEAIIALANSEQTWWKPPWRWLLTG
jgi:hypothetical protein